jgi:hypothetical protein
MRIRGAASPPQSPRVPTSRRRPQVMGHDPDARRRLPRLARRAGRWPVRSAARRRRSRSWRDARPATPSWSRPAFVVARVRAAALIVWLLVSESRSPAAAPEPPRECCSFVKAGVSCRLSRVLRSFRNRCRNDAAGFDPEHSRGGSSCRPSEKFVSCHRWLRSRVCPFS